jgi:hypothetical protein
VEFANLRLVITDEQHRFGVRQRTKLEEKGMSPHVLVMSATPIPRSLSLVLYGDLDISIVDELPPGRTPVMTRIVPEEKREGLYSFICAQAAQGQQPMQGGMQARPVTGREEAVAATVFPGAPMLFLDRAHGAVFYKAIDPQTGAAEFVEFVMATPAPPAPQYATLADLESIRSEIAQVREMIPTRRQQKGADAE